MSVRMMSEEKEEEEGEKERRRRLRGRRIARNPRDDAPYRHSWSES